MKPIERTDVAVFMDLDEALEYASSAVETANAGWRDGINQQALATLAFHASYAPSLADERDRLRDEVRGLKLTLARLKGRQKAATGEDA